MTLLVTLYKSLVKLNGMQLRGIFPYSTLFRYVKIEYK